MAEIKSPKIQDLLTLSLNDLQKEECKLKLIDEELRRKEQEYRKYIVTHQEEIRQRHAYFASLIEKCGLNGWEIFKRSPFPEEDKRLVSSATVILTPCKELQVCFMMKSGGQHFMRIFNLDDCAPGDVVDLDKTDVMTLGKEGEADIQRLWVKVI